MPARADWESYLYHARLITETKPNATIEDLQRMRHDRDLPCDRRIGSAALKGAKAERLRPQTSLEQLFTTAKDKELLATGLLQFPTERTPLFDTEVLLRHAQGAVDELLTNVREALVQLVTAPVESAERQIRACEDEMGRHSRAFGDLEAQLQPEIERLRAEIAEAEAETAKAREEAERSRADAAERGSRLGGELSQANRLVAELQAQLEAAQAAEAVARERLASMEERLNKSEKAALELRLRADADSLRYAEQEARLGELRGALEREQSNGAAWLEQAHAAQADAAAARNDARQALERERAWVETKHLHGNTGDVPLSNHL